MIKHVGIRPHATSVAPDGSLESESGAGGEMLGGLSCSPRGVKTSSCSALKCSETVAGHELLSLSPSVHQLPALASGGTAHNIRGPHGSCSPPAFFCSHQPCGGQIKSRFVITAPVLGSAMGKGLAC